MKYALPFSVCIKKTKKKKSKEKKRPYLKWVFGLSVPDDCRNMAVCVAVDLLPFEVAVLLEILWALQIRPLLQ